MHAKRILSPSLYSLAKRNAPSGPSRARPTSSYENLAGGRKLLRQSRDARRQVAVGWTFPSPSVRRPLSSRQGKFSGRRRRPPCRTPSTEENGPVEGPARGLRRRLAMLTPRPPLINLLTAHRRTSNALLVGGPLGLRRPRPLADLPVQPGPMPMLGLVCTKT